MRINVGGFNALCSLNVAGIGFVCPTSRTAAATERSRTTSLTDLHNPLFLGRFLAFDWSSETHETREKHHGQNPANSARVHDRLPLTSRRRGPPAMRPHAGGRLVP